MFGDTDATVVLKYYLYRAVGGPGFIWPVYVLYLRSHGLSFAAIGAVGAVQTVVVLAGEIPTGYAGDRIGRRDSLAVAQVVFAAATLGMIVSTDFAGFAASFGLLSFATTWVSGSADAWLYDVLDERLDESEYTRVKGRGSAIGQWVTALTMIAGGIMYVVDPVAPFLALLGSRLLTLLVVLTLPRTARYAGGGTSREDADVADEIDGGDTDDEAAESDDGDGGLSAADTLPLVRERLLRPPLRSFVLYVALFFGVSQAAGVYIQPIAVETLEGSVGSALATHDVPEAATLGVLYASFTAVSAVASDRASDLEAWLGVRRALLVVPVAIAVLLVVPVVAPLLVFPMFFGLRAGRSLLQPIVGQYLNDRVDSVGRATVLSAVAMVYALVRVPFTLGSGVLADLTSPLATVAVMGGVFLVVGGAVFAFRSPVQDEVGVERGEVAGD